MTAMSSGNFHCIVYSTLAERERKGICEGSGTSDPSSFTIVEMKRIK
tara:strand:+ start:386 stop:526 length:141 start_codon:yes stop_codon:yes gene_type:complete